MSTGTNNSIETKHYRVQDLSGFEEHSEKLTAYINDVEKAFPVVEQVFGREWPSGQITLILAKSKGSSYGRKGEEHWVRIGVEDERVQENDFPENLWGCLLHETLHAFMNPIIHRERGSNELDGEIHDKYCKEVLIHSFQRLVYLRLREKDILTQQLLKAFLQKLEDGMVGGGEELYGCYNKMFSKDLSTFSKFIELLYCSERPLVRKETFWEDLKRVKKLLDQ